MDMQQHDDSQRRRARFETAQALALLEHPLDLGRAVEAHRSLRTALGFVERIVQDLAGETHA